MYKQSTSFSLSNRAANTLLKYEGINIENNFTFTKYKSAENVKYIFKDY